MAKVTFLPFRKSVEVPMGSTILQAAVAAGVQIQSTCGGRGTCGKCKVQISSDGWVLACQHMIEQDLTVELNVQKDAFERKLSLNHLKDIMIAPSIRKYHVQVEKPSAKNQTPDWERLLAALSNRTIPFNRRVAANLPETLQKAQFRVTAVLDENFLLAVEEGETLERSYGLSVDIGTTTVAAYLMDLNNGTVLTSGAITNPQHVFGADVISRITYASEDSDKRRQLQVKLINALNEIIAQLCEAAGIDHQEIYQAVVVGNTTMSHLFLGIDPTYLATAPFIPVFRQAVEVEAKELGLRILESGKVVVLPNIAGYVGSDTVGVMLSTGIDRLPGLSLAIDIGTNGEIILAGNKQILTCSAAAGPAFEGAEINCGMRAAEGAIEGVLIGDDVELAVIGGSKPRGICGSGLIDAIAQLRKSGIIEASGRLTSKADQLEKLPPAVRERLRNDDQKSEFILVWSKDSATGEDVVLTQKDIRKLQLAKGAIMAGIQLLLQEMKVSAEAIDRVLIAGAFGHYIKKENAVSIGLLPSLPLDKITTVGNAAGDGAKIALLSKEERTRAEALAGRTVHIELSARRDFQTVFMKALSL
ncbi:ASKHA domain-containing protein [Desulfosporosinus youngiae]|uniref:Putative metal-binding protein n=1 Tax=Desulfosporosinus youngiae DSM 17734 TaxID=768710 RepID=H5Y5F2_9FIRM|nr:ASKHA domain-containing protein [Desulfosporosinus youngiae]EHQ90402.1 putative metal-binding protein [Desulfosporosinus youngiae DSM 17734]